MDDAAAREIEAQFRQLTAAFRVPGATLGIQDGDGIREFATGVLNVETGVETTTDSLFQIGSITKTMTATLVMQLVEDGMVDLDAPVTEYLPGVRFGDGATVRQLLTHTSGVDGDFFDDFGRGDDAIEKYVDACGQLDQVFPPGLLYSYCNAGFVVLGRMVEVLRGQPFHQVLRERLTKPIGMDHTVTLPEEAIVHRVAAGHVINFPDLTPKLAPVWGMPRAQTPAGSTPCSTVGDLLRFAGGGVLSEPSMQAMRQPQHAVPTAVAGFHPSIGLAWHLFEWDGVARAEQGGGTIGQLSNLATVPGREVAIAMLTNSLTGGAVFRPLFSAIFRDLYGIEMEPVPTIPEEPVPVDLSRYTGTYERMGQAVTVSESDGRIRLVTQFTGPMAAFAPGDLPALTLTPVDDETFVGPGLIPGVPTEAHFAEPGPDGRYRYLLMGRVARRAAGS